jgi:hypothetical protein
MSIVGNMKYAALNRQSVEIGGGLFSPDELRDAALKLESAERLLACLEKAVSSLEWAAVIIGDMPPKCEYLEGLREAKEAIAKVKG